MRSFFFYHKDSGVIHPNGVSTNSDDLQTAMLYAKANAPAEHIPIEGNFAPASQRIDPATGAVISFMPSAPSADHVWSDSLKCWIYSEQASAKRDEHMAALGSLSSTDSAAVRALMDHVLGISPEPGQPTAAERLAAIHAAKIELRKKL